MRGLRVAMLRRRAQGWLPLLAPALVLLFAAAVLLETVVLGWSWAVRTHVHCRLSALPAFAAARAAAVAPAASAAWPTPGWPGALELAAQAAVGSAENNATVVTAWVELPSKHRASEYYEWMSNLLSIASPMVVFVEPQHLPRVRRLRAGRENHTVFVPTSLQELYVARYRTLFDCVEAADPERSHGHVAPLYMMWHEKLSWLVQVAERNPFGSRYFVWADVGYFREPAWGARFLRDRLWPSANRVRALDDDRYLVLEVGATVGGGMLAGTARALRTLAPVYFAALERLLASTEYVRAAKDQEVYNDLVRERPELFRVLHTRDEWFFLGGTELCSWCTPIGTDDRWTLVHRLSACALGCSVWACVTLSLLALLAALAVAARWGVLPQRRAAHRDT